MKLPDLKPCKIGRLIFFYLWVKIFTHLLQNRPEITKRPHLKSAYLGTWLAILFGHQLTARKGEEDARSVGRKDQGAV